MTDIPKIRIGTRNSPLALVPAYEIRDKLIKDYPEFSIEGKISIIKITTMGDRYLQGPLSDIGGKGLFTKEIDYALLNNEIDIGIHSMKDVPIYLPKGIILPIILPREDPRDAFISFKYNHFREMPARSIIGSSSLRRKAIILNKYPDLKVVNFRGNVQTRLRKLQEGQVDATILALSGLNRLRYSGIVKSILSENDMLPAIAQGAIGLTMRTNDDYIKKWFIDFHCKKSEIQITAERAALIAIDGSCRTPIAAFTKYQDNGSMQLCVGLLHSNKTHWIYTTRSIDQPNMINAHDAGFDAGIELKKKADLKFN